MNSYFAPGRDDLTLHRQHNENSDCGPLYVDKIPEWSCNWDMNNLAMMIWVHILLAIVTLRGWGNLHRHQYVFSKYLSSMYISPLPVVGCNMRIIWRIISLIVLEKYHTYYLGYRMIHNKIRSLWNCSSWHRNCIRITFLCGSPEERLTHSPNSRFVNTEWEDKRALTVIILSW